MIPQDLHKRECSKALPHGKDAMTPRRSAAERLWLNWVNASLIALVLVTTGLPGRTLADDVGAPEATVRLDFRDTELTVVIDTIAELTKKNFIYDDSLRGKKVTIISPEPVTLEQAYAVFESMLQVKNFTTVEGPGGIIKVIPVVNAKQSNISTEMGLGRGANRDRYITRLIPMKFIDASEITKTLANLVSKNAAMVAYAPTNTIILTDSEANIQRILTIIDAIDVETYLAQMHVFKIKHADAAVLSGQLADIFGGKASGSSAHPTPSRTRSSSSRRSPTPSPSQSSFGERGQVRFITDERSNSIIVLAARTEIEEIRSLIERLDVPVTGGGRIHVVYLRNADAEELAETLNALLQGQSSSGASRRSGPATPGAPQALKSAVTELSEGITITADIGTNSLVVQASKEAFATVKEVIAQLDIRRPQVLVEALIMEVKVSDSKALGFSAIVESVSGNTTGSGGSVSGPRRPIGSSGNDPDADPDNPVTLPEFVGQRLTDTALGAPATFFGTFSRDTRDENGGSLIQGIIIASAGNSDTNIVASPHILTTDNEEAEIKIGQNIPIITSSQQTDEATSINRVNVERQDIGVTLRVTPQISEGDSLRLEIYQEITKIADTSEAGLVTEVGPTLLNRSVDNTVVVKDGQTVVIGGLLDEVTTEGVRKVPFLGDIPFLGWLFKSTTESVDKTNLLIFLTPHIVRSAEDMEMETIRKREEFRYYSKQDEDVDKRLVEELGVDLPDRSIDPARRTLDQLDKKYPLENYKDLEKLKEEAHAKRMRNDARGQVQYMLLAAVYQDESLAAETLTQLVDGGYEGTLTAEDAGGSILYRIVLGPYDDLTGAELTSATIREVFGLTPTVLLEHLEPEQPEL